MGLRLKIETLKQTQAFYIWELKKESLTEKERASYLLALKSIEKIIQEREMSVRKKGKYLDKIGGYQKKLNW
ncbi:unnamed protein product [marine sediment metagenome]|uniref:Uncharacterized protein n=1 Tax=marine sediment metagenome TaxID=412755 RepID=X1TYS0_9ZZZZ